MTNKFHPVVVRREKFLARNDFFLNKELTSAFRYMKNIKKELDQLLMSIDLKKGGEKKLLTEIEGEDKSKELEEYGKLHHHYQECLMNLKEVLVHAEKEDRIRYKELLKENKDFRSMIRLVNKPLNNRIEKYLNNEYDESYRKLRKIEYPLSNIITRAIKKTSPYLLFNEVSFSSNNINDFEYKVDKELITPNFVFFHRLYEKIILNHWNIKNTVFRVNKRTKIEGEYLFFFSNSTDNYKIYKAKDGLGKLKVNKFIEFLLSRDIVTTLDLQKAFKLTDIEVHKVFTRLYDIGLLEIMEYLDEKKDIFKQILSQIQKLDAIEYNRFNFITIKKMQEQFKHINKDLNEEIINSIEKKYNKLVEYNDMDDMPNNIMVYGDNITSSSKCGEVLSSSITELLSVYKIFDVNELIKNEFINNIEKYMVDNKIPFNHPYILNELTSANLKYAEFWTNPWFTPKNICIKNKEILNIRDNFKKEFMMLNQHKDSIDIEEVIADLKINILNDKFNSRYSPNGFFSVFFQKDKNKTIINNIYPGYGSFYIRFLRYTNIQEKYRKEINEFYYDDKCKYAEINETLGFNANVSNEVYLPYRLIDDISRSVDYKQNYEKIIQSNNCMLVYKENELFLEFENEYIKPVINSSLIRALYPGKLAFVSSIFTNINFITNLLVLKINYDKDINILPRVTYKDLVLNRKKHFVKNNVFKDLQNKEWFERYISIRNWIEENNIGNEFYIRVRKKGYIGKDILSFDVEFQKPQYFNLESPLLMRHLASILTKSAELIIEESIPKDSSSPEFMQEVRVNE